MRGRPLAKAICLVCVIALASRITTAEIATDAEARLALDGIVDQLNALERWFSDAERRSAEIELQIQQQDQAISQLRQDSRVLQKSLGGAQKKIAVLQKKQNDLEQQTDAQRQVIIAHLQAASRLSGDDFIKQLLSQRSGADAQRYMRYHGYFSQQRLATLEKFKANVGKLQQTREALDQQLVEKTRQSNQLAAQTRDLQSQRNERASAIKALATQRKNKTDQQEALLADSERLRELISALQAQSTVLDGKAFAAAKGKLPRPMRGKVRHRFGETRSGTNLRWRGVDLAASVGTTVNAVFRGKIIFSDWLRGFGLITIVDHGGGYMTLYGHADTLLKNVGDWVEGGEPLAEAGDSGGGYQPGIYFELRHEGSVQNPKSWLSR